MSDERKGCGLKWTMEHEILRDVVTNTVEVTSHLQGTTRPGPVTPTVMRKKIPLVMIK
jgi:hypothetical protein